MRIYFDDYACGELLHVRDEADTDVIKIRNAIDGDFFAGEYCGDGIAITGKTRRIIAAELAEIIDFYPSSKTCSGKEYTINWEIFTCILCVSRENRTIEVIGIEHEPLTPIITMIR